MVIIAPESVRAFVKRNIIKCHPIITIVRFAFANGARQAYIAFSTNN